MRKDIGKRIVRWSEGDEGRKRGEKEEMKKKRNNRNSKIKK